MLGAWQVYKIDKLPAFQYLAKNDTISVMLCVYFYFIPGRLLVVQAVTLALGILAPKTRLQVLLYRTSNLCIFKFRAYE